MSSTKIDVTQIDLPGNPNELLAGDGSAVTVGADLTLAGGTLAASPQTLGGDLSGTTAAATVEAIQGNPVSAVPPTPGQALAWTGASWAPATIAGGGGGDSGGFLYYLQYSVAGAAPAPAGAKAMSRAYVSVAQSTVPVAVAQSPSYSTVAEFVTPVGDPSVTTIPAGLWDLAFYSATTGTAPDTAFRFLVQTWNGVTATTIATSDDVYITDGLSIQQYTASVYVPPTVVLASTRIVVVIEATRFTVGAQTVTGYFDGATVSHVHTSIGAPGGTGLLKVVAGVLQTPATLLVNADVDNAANIFGSKLQAASAANAGSLAAADFNRIIASGDVTVTARAATVTRIQSQPVTGGAVAGQYLRFSGAAYTPTTVLAGTSSQLAAADGSTVLVGSNLTLSGGILSGPSTNIRNVLFVTTNGNDGTADGSINLPFASLQGAHDYALANFDPNDHVVVAVAPGEYSGALNVTRNHTHFSAIGTIAPTDRTVIVSKAAVNVDLRGTTSPVTDVVSFEGILFVSSAGSAIPTAYITGDGLFRVVFSACTVQSISTNSANFAAYCDNVPAVPGQSVIEFDACVVTSTEPTADSITVNAERGAWSFVDSKIVNLSDTIASAISATDDGTVTIKSSTVQSQGFAPTVILDGTLIYPSVKLALDTTTVANRSPGDGVFDCSAISLGRRGYARVTGCTFEVLDLTASFAVTGGNPSYLAIGGEQFVPGGNRLIGSTVSIERLDSFTGQYLAVTTDYTVALSDYVVDCDGNFKVTLPSTSTIVGRMFVIKNSGAGVILVQSTGGELIDGTAPYPLNPLDVIMVMSTGTAWIVI